VEGRPLRGGSTSPAAVASTSLGETGTGVPPGVAVPAGDGDASASKRATDSASWLDAGMLSRKKRQKSGLLSLKSFLLRALRRRRALVGKGAPRTRLSSDIS